MNILGKIKNKEALRDINYNKCMESVFQGVKAAQEHCIAEAMRCVNTPNSDKCQKLIIQASAYGDVLNIKKQIIDALEAQKEN